MRVATSSRSVTIRVDVGRHDVAHAALRQVALRAQQAGRPGFCAAGLKRVPLRHEVVEIALEVLEPTALSCRADDQAHALRRLEPPQEAPRLVALAAARDAPRDAPSGPCCAISTR